MKKHYIFLLLVIISMFPLWLHGQPAYDIRSYSSSDGLSQTTATRILQDKNRLLWLSTWDGLNSFNGYEFTTYKASHQERGIPLSNNRITYIDKDCKGYIWCISYDGQVSRFNPVTEEFDSISLPENFKAARIIPTKSEHVWLQSNDNDAIRINYSAKTSEYKTDIVFKGKENKNKDKLTIYEDEEGGEWIYTSYSGLYYIKPHSNNLELLDSIGAYCLTETDNYISLGLSNGRILTYSKQNKKIIQPMRKLPTQSDIIFILQNTSSELILTLDDGLFIDGKHYALPNSIQSKPILTYHLDKEGFLWMETSYHELTLFNTQKHTFTMVPFRKSVHPSGTDRLRVQEDSKGNRWFYPYYGGLGLLIPKGYTLNNNIPLTSRNCLQQTEAGNIYTVRELQKSIPWIKDDSHYVSYIDNDDNLWLSTTRWFGRISIKRGFQNHTITQTESPSRSNDYRSIMQDHCGRIWAGDRLGEIQIYTPDYELLGKLTLEGTISQDYSHHSFFGQTYYIHEDYQHRIWIGTKRNGLWVATPKGKQFSIKHYKHQSNDIYSLVHDNIYWILEDSNKRIWIGSYNGGICYVEEKDGNLRFIHAYNRLKQYPIEQFNQVRCLALDNKGYLWAGTTNGIVTFSTHFDSPEQVSFTTYQRQPNDTLSLSNNNVQNIFLSSQKRLFIGTFGGGLCEAICANEGNIQFKSYIGEKGIPTDIIYSIAEDNQHKLWLSGENGLATFNPSNNDFDYYDERFIGIVPMFNEGKAICTSDGQLVFPTLYGILHFNPQDIRKSNKCPNIIFTNLQIAGKNISPQKEGILSHNINYTSQITLPHKQNMFTLHFAAADMSNAENISYMYKLEGFDNTWHENGKQRTISYTNLPTGTYLFKIRSTNGDGVWVNNERCLTIIVSPSFWETPLAWCLYLLATVIIIYIVHTFYKLRNRIYIERQTAQYKLQFFTDVSHELRTPLTLITAPIENLLHYRELPAFAKEQLQLIQRNANQMLKLVNQILDFRKLQSKEVPLHFEAIELNAFLKHIIADFKPLAEERQINLEYHSTIQKQILYADTEKMECILTNLLTNAFKYTPDKRNIQVILSVNQQGIHINVTDEGIGIPLEQQKHIFKRFATIHNQNFRGTASTGIGLALVKELTERQNGTLTFSSEEGKGSSFILHFPINDKEHTAITENKKDSQSTQGNKNKSLDLFTDNKSSIQYIPTILLVEDNDDMRHFLRSIFENDYRILEATQGKEGYELACSQMPDIVITDLMMPVMDGIQLVNVLKTDIRTSHIPVILLTAKDSIESQLDAMKEGADDYITKPFSTLYLKARTENLLAQRKKLQSLYCEKLLNNASHSPSDAMEEKQLTKADQNFIKKLTDFMEQEMSNGELTVDMLAEATCMGRSSFFNKLKNLIGISPSEFIQQMRVKRAARLIEENQYTMAEISTLVGINDPHYFSRYFKKVYGITPTEYKRKVLTK